MIWYRPFGDRTPDTQYRDLLRRIIDGGETVGTQQDVSALMIFGHQMRFNLANGFPLITERDLVSAPEGKASQFTLALAELCAFLNGARTVDEMREFGCGWWSAWATAEKCAKRGLPPGDLGDGSYGVAFRAFPGPNGPFDQWKAVIDQLKRAPHLRTHFVSPWFPEYVIRGESGYSRTVVAPCHGWVHIHADPDFRTLSLHHFQRSADAPVGLVFNLVQYAGLTLMLAQVLGYTAHELVYTVSDTHIYRHDDPEKDQLSSVEDMLATEPQCLPTVTLDPAIDDLFAFRPEHFTVTDYHPQLERRRIWTPV